MARTNPTRPVPKKRGGRRGKGRPTDPNMAVGSDAIVNETCKLLAKMPPAKVTRAAVARAAGVDPSLIRYYFRNRSLLILAAFKKLTDEYTGFLNEESEKCDGTPHGRLCASVAALFRLSTKYPYYYDLLVDEIAVMKEKEAQDYLQKLQRDHAELHRSIIEAGIADGSFRKMDANLLLIAISGMCHFFSKGALVLEDGGTTGSAMRQAYFDLVCDVLLNGLEQR